MFIFKLLRKLLKAIQSGETPSQLAAGFVLGMLIGITPFFSLLNLIIILVVILINVNIGMAVISFLIFSAIGYLMDPVFHAIGYWLLVDVSILTPVWSLFYSLPLAPLTAFNNTAYLGSLVCGGILIMPVYVLIRTAVIQYRERIQQRVNRWKIVRMMKGSKLVSVVQSIRLERD